MGRHCGHPPGWRGRHPRIIALWPGLHNEAYGIACDIGSTTIAMNLVSLLSGRVAASVGMQKPQIRFGEDLMSRVSYVMMNPGGAEAITASVREAINALVDKVCTEGNVKRTDILDAVFVGNPVMHHFFLGIDPTELGGAPFALAVSGAVKGQDLRHGYSAQRRCAALHCAVHRGPCRR